ncbi:hypothetical protein L0F63_004016 [Massospora cicadina]|nr:hypothetical protein L0F63_004016 [Massospora cicadina]
MVGVLDHLTALAAIDSHSSKYPHIDFLHAFTALGRDLNFLHTLESASLGSLRAHLSTGHGIPLTHYKHWGPSLLCWVPPATQLPVSVPELISWLSEHPLPAGSQLAYFALEPAATPCPFLPPHIAGYFHPASFSLADNDLALFDRTEIPPGALFKEPLVALTHKKTSPLVAPLQWALVLDPPLIACPSVACQLAGHLTDSEFQASGMPLFQDVMLAATFSESDVRLDPNATYFGANSPWGARLKACPIFQRYRLSAHEPVPCQTVHRIPFSHPQDLLNIIQAIRQQNILNALFKSCFNPHTLVDPALALELEAFDVEVSLHRHPLSMSVRFKCFGDHAILTFLPQVTGPPIQIDFMPAEELQPLAEGVHRLLTNSMNIPLAIGFILKKVSPTSQHPA